MRYTWLIARRELASMLASPSAWLIAALILCVDGLLFNAFALGAEPKPSQRVLEEFFQITSGTTMVSALLIAMRSFVEERAAGTLLLLFHSPVRDIEIVLGKFLAGFAFLVLMVLSSGYLLGWIAFRGVLVWPHVAVGFAGLCLLGGAALSIGLLGSVLARSQLVAGLLSAALLVTLLLGWLLARITDPPWSEVMMYLALWQSQFLPLQRGVLGLSNVVYFVSLMALFLGATALALGGQRWD